MRRGSRRAFTETVAIESEAPVIDRRKALRLGIGAAVASAAAVPIVSRGGVAGAATVLTSDKVVTTLTANTTSVTLPSGIADQVNFSTNLSAGTLTVATPSGTPTDGQCLEFRLTSTNAQTYSWSSVFHGSLYGSLPPLTSGGGLTDYFLFTWRASEGCWDLAANVQGFV
jgi:hypothetical protein